MHLPLDGNRLINGHEARIAEITGDTEATLNETDTDRLLLLNRLEERMPGLDVGQHEVEWTKVPDGAEAVVVEGGGFDGGTGYFIANAGNDLHVVGTMAPLIPGKIGLVAIHPDGIRELLRVIEDPIGDEGRN